MSLRSKLFAVGVTLLSTLPALAGVVKVGAGSYSDTFPGTDQAGRNGYPTVSPQVSGNAATRPIPTNDWWSNELISDHGQSMFNYPLGLRPENDGLGIIKNMFNQATMLGDGPLKVSLDGLNCSKTTICDYSDWTVTFSWADHLYATVAQASPFVYFTRSTGAGKVSVKAFGSFSTLPGADNVLVITGSYNQANYAVYAPAGSKWNVSGNSASNTLNGKNYFSALLLPSDADAKTIAQQWLKYAFVFPADTRAEYSYDQASSTVTTTYKVTPDVKEDSDTNFLMGLLPHHWSHITGAPSYEKSSYTTIRGEMKMLATNEFTTNLKFSGILPTLPAVASSATGFSPDELHRLIDQVNQDNGLVDWTDSYNDGQLLNRLVQIGRIAAECGYTEGFEKALQLVKERVERWLTYQQGDIAFMFYYHKPWTTLLGYPAGHGQDTNINDHHFHWGYIIGAAAFIEQYAPGWKEKWGPMIDLLVRDGGSPYRDDPMFPYLRNFAPYAGHSWANGTGNLGIGTDQESSSESMQFASSLIHWGGVSGNTKVRDLGIYLYATELSAIEEYWFDIHHRVFTPDYNTVIASRIFTNGYDDKNFWGGGLAGSYGIEIYPVHAGSTYLVRDNAFAHSYWDAMKRDTGILRNEANDNIWYDAWIRYVAMIDPAEALNLYSKCTKLGNKFGDSQAHTYQWVHALAAMGTPATDITSDFPFATVFENQGLRTYVAQNYGTNPVTVNFSDGYSLSVPAGKLVSLTNGDPLPTASISANPADGIVGEPTLFTASLNPHDYSVSSASITVNGEAIATTSASPNTYEAMWTPLAKGTYSVGVTVKCSDGREFSVAKTQYTVDAGGSTGGGGGNTSTTAEFTFSPEDASQGSFSGGGKVSLSYDGSDVTVHASFDGDYIGFAGPWLWNYTEGFAESAMSPDGDGYKATLSGYAPGTSVKVAVKIAFAGGMGVTPIYELKLDNPSVVFSPVDTDLLCVWPNPTTQTLHVMAEGVLELYSITGFKTIATTVEGITSLDLTTLPSGYYVAVLRGAEGNVLATRRVIKL